MELENELPAATQTENQRKRVKSRNNRGQRNKGRDRHRVHVVQRGAAALYSLQRNPFTPFLQLGGLVSSLYPFECLFVFAFDDC